MAPNLTIPPALILESIALGNATTLVSFFGLIIEKTKEALAFRKECSELANACVVLSLGLLERRASLGAYRSTKEFERCLREVFLAVSECSTSWAVRHIGWEPFIEDKLKSLKKDLERWQQVFNSEVLMGLGEKSDTAAQDLQAMHRELKDLASSIRNDIPDRREYLGQVRQLTDELSTTTKYVGLRSSSFLVKETDERLSTIHLESEPVSGSFDGHAVTFERIGGIHQHVDHITKIYHMIGDIALVQTVYGLVEINNSFHAIVQDLTGMQNIAQITAYPAQNQYSTTEKLKFLYELAATLSALHENHLLVKVLSDQTIFIEVSEGHPRPLLSGLKEARDIWAVTDRQEQDARYEAPETSTLSMHTRMSDVWSLAVVAQQWLNLKLPYGFTYKDVVNNHIKDEIRQNLKSHNLPFDDDIMIGHGRVAKILRQCLEVDSRLRPTAALLAQQIYEVLIEEGSISLLGQVKPVEEASQGTSGGLTLNQVLGVVSSRDIKGKGFTAGTSGTTSFSRLSLEAIIYSSTECSPSAYYAVGCAYLYGLVQDSVSDGATFHWVPEDVFWAKKALPYLENAEQMGYTDANKPLFEAYKILASHHRDKFAAKDR